MTDMLTDANAPIRDTRALTGMDSDARIDFDSDVPVNRDLAEEAEKAAKAPAEEKAFDERIQDLECFITREPLIRELDLKVLEYCAKRRALGAIEERMAAFPEFSGATRDQYSLITELVNHEGLRCFELDAAGAVVTEADKAGLDANAIDDLVVGFAYETTPVGAAVLERMNPDARLDALLAEKPERLGIYQAVLEFLQQKRSFADVDVMLGAHEGTQADRAAGVQSSVYVDKLERAGAIFFQHGWQVTDAGNRYLARLAGAPHQDDAQPQSACSDDVQEQGAFAAGGDSTGAQELQDAREGDGAQGSRNSVASFQAGDADSAVADIGAGRADSLSSGAVLAGQASGQGETHKDSEDASIEEVLESRSDFYLMLAGFYFQPLSQDQIDQMALQDFAGFATGDALLDEGFDDIRRVLRKRNTGTRSALATEWTGTFGGAESYKARYCVPNASVFLDESGSTYGAPRNAAFRLYAKERLGVKENAGVPESHLSIELEFLSVMSREAAACLAAGNTAEALEKLEVSRQFIEGHLLVWVPLLRDLADEMLKTRFYRGVLKITLGYLKLDLDTLEDLKAEIEA